MKKRMKISQVKSACRMTAAKLFHSGLVAILAICFTLSANAQTIYTLEECIDKGLQQNWSIRIEKNEQKISDNNATAGNAGYLPTLDASGRMNGDASQGNHNEYVDLGLDLNWTIFDGLGIQAQYSKLKELKNMGELNTIMAIEDLITDISVEYYNLIRQTTRLKNLRTSLDLSKERLRIVEERYSIGSSSRLDYQQAQVDFNADSSNFINQLERLHTSRINLNKLMALEDVEQNTIPADTSIVPSESLVKETLWENTLNKNISLLIVEKQHLISELDWKKVRSRQLPYLKFSAGYGYGAGWYGSNSASNYSRTRLDYAVTLGINIFDGMNRRREQRNAKIEIENRQMKIEEVKLSLRAELSNLWMAYRNYLDLLSLEKSNLVAARENYDIAIDRYKLGDLSGIELREAQLSLLDAEERCSIAEISTKVCEISLHRISGDLR